MWHQQRKDVGWICRMYKQQGCINNKALLDSTGNYIQYLRKNHTGKECLKKECLYVYK